MTDYESKSQEDAKRLRSVAGVLRDYTYKTYAADLEDIARRLKYDVPFLRKLEGIFEAVGPDLIEAATRAKAMESQSKLQVSADALTTWAMVRRELGGLIELTPEQSCHLDEIGGALLAMDSGARNTESKSMGDQIAGAPRKRYVIADNWHISSESLADPFDSEADAERERFGLEAAAPDRMYVTVGIMLPTPPTECKSIGRARWAYEREASGEQWDLGGMFAVFDTREEAEEAQRRYMRTKTGPNRGRVYQVGEVTQPTECRSVAIDDETLAEAASGLRVMAMAYEAAAKDPLEILNPAEGRYNGVRCRQLADQLEAARTDCGSVDDGGSSEQG